MTKDNKKVDVIKPPSSVKYKKFCRTIYRKYHKQFIIVYNKEVRVDIPLLMDILVQNLENKNKSYIRNVKYTNMDFINGIMDVINNCTYWTRYNNPNYNSNFGSYLNKKHNHYCKIGVYDCLYNIIVNIYFSKSKYSKLKNQTIDTTFIRNLYGTEMIQRNPQYKSKNGIKVSTINDVNGVPHSIAIGKGATNDAKIAISQLKFSFIELNTKNVKNNNKYSQKIFADAQYYTKEFYDTLMKNSFIPVTDVNIRNTKDEIKLKEMKNIKRKYLKECRKRVSVERSFGWLHKYPKIDRYVEKKIGSYKGLLLLALSITVNKKLT